MSDRVKRPFRVLTALTLVGDVLLLQLSWLVASLPVVTAVPAAFALQRCLTEVLDDARADDAPGDAGHGGVGWRTGTGGGRGFFRRFVTALGRLWPLGVAAPVVLAAFAFSALFWISAEDPPRVIALAVLLPLGGLMLAVYLGMLGAATAHDERTGVRDLVRAGWRTVVLRPLRAAACIVLLVTWLLVLSRLPTLVLITSGVVPALAAYWLARSPRDAAAAAITARR